METRQQKIDEIARIHRSLTNITPSAETIETIEKLRSTAKLMGASIVNYCEPSRERSLALTHLEDSTMWAVKSLVLHQDDQPQEQTHGQ